MKFQFVNGHRIVGAEQFHKFDQTNGHVMDLAGIVLGNGSRIALSGVVMDDGHVAVVGTLVKPEEWVRTGDIGKKH